MTLLDRVRNTIRRHRLLDGGETVLVAVSGGADSVALLHALHALAPEFHLTLAVAHVDHGLRPDSGADADFVESLARRYGLPVAIERITVRLGGSPEATAREARYAALRRQADRVGAGRVALGHTADDQAETVLMRVLAGTGSRGLAGIPPRRGRLIRPLIDTRRADIVEGLDRAGIAWREDPSNHDPKFLRNRIRHELLPLLAASYNPAVVAALARLAELTRELLGGVDAVAARELADLVSAVPAASSSGSTAAADVGGGQAASGSNAEGDIVLPRSRLRELPAEVGAAVLHRAAVRLGHEAPLRAWAHRGLRRILAESPPRRPFSLGGLTIECSGDLVRIGRAQRPPVSERAVLVPGVTPLPEIGHAIEARTLQRTADYVLPSTPARVAFDADQLRGPLVVRARRRGDHFAPYGDGAARRLKSVLIAAHIPRWQRDSLALVECDGAIVWIAGVRRSGVAPVTAETRRLLELAYIPLSDTIGSP